MVIQDQDDALFIYSCDKEQRNYPPETTPDPRFSEEEQESFVTDQGSNESEDADRNLNSIRDNERNVQDYHDYTDQTADQREFDNRVEQRRIDDREDTRERFDDRRDQREFDDRIELPNERTVIDGVAEERRSGLARSANYPRPNQSGGGPAERNAQKYNQRESDQRAPSTIASPPATRPQTSQTEVSPYAPTRNPQSQTYYTEKAKTFRPVDPNWQSESSFVQAPSNADYDSGEAGGHPPGFVQEIAFGENEGRDQGRRQGREQGQGRGQEQGRDDYEELVQFPANQQKEAEGPPPNRNPNQNFDYNNGAESQSYSDEMAPPQEGYKGYEAMAPNTQSTNQSPRGKFDGYNEPNRYDPQHEYDHESSELGSESNPPIETTPSFGPATMNRRPRVMIYALGDDRHRPTNEFRNYRTDSSTASTPTTPFYKTRQTTDYEKVPSTIPPYYEPPMTFPPPPDHSDPHPPSFYPPAYNMKPFPAPSKPAPRDYYTKPQGRVNFENLAKEMEHNARISSAEESHHIPRKIRIPQSEHFEIFTRVPPSAAAQEVQRSTPESNFDMSPTVSSINGRSNAEIYFHGYKRQYEQKEQREQQLQEDQKQSKIIAEMPTEQSVDKASSCCQWALHGLCDRNWKKVRPLCPKSCGTLVCEEIEGIKSCTRILDVDVEQCFRSMHFARHTLFFNKKKTN
ncbi:hypothetical protein WR25_23310 [Diploscapter pachys]|uniref:ShKT domain-containing protein n=1 Tax=Diploscapter pachys TaxID=2018661 RepID=A0A2A2J7R1_9BILA|nr:hypothetical protein WR25_23310 [Diploscapter pachys]